MKNHPIYSCLGLLRHFVPRNDVVLFTALMLAASFSTFAYAAEVEEIEESDIPPELSEAVELHKVGDLTLLPVVDITALGTFSKLEGANEIGGVNIRGIISPVLRINESNYLIPLYYGGYNRERQVVVEEEGGRVYNEIMDHNVTLEAKHLIDESTAVKVDGIVRLHYVKEKGYGWSDGLYDYNDLGAASSIEYYFERTKTSSSSINIGGEYYHREYPNYTSLIALASVTAPETDEKDYNGFRPILKYKYQDPKIISSFFYSPLYKAYDDKKIIDSSGVLGSDERHDWFHYINGEFSYMLDDIPIALGIGVTGIIVYSNQNYYDSRGTVTLADDVFTQDYYDFNSLDINPKLTYIHKVEGQKNPATLTMGYAFTRRDYNDRKAQRADSTYTDGTQLDEIHTVHAQAVYPINEKLSFVASGNFVSADSNMDYETYYRYGYKTYYAGAGLRLKY